MEGHAYFDTPSCRTVRRAVEDYGGVEQLASFIGSDALALAHWYAGDDLPPVAIFLKALDIVARGPLGDGPLRLSRIAGTV